MASIFTKPLTKIKPVSQNKKVQLIEDDHSYLQYGVSDFCPHEIKNIDFWPTDPKVNNHWIYWLNNEKQPQTRERTEIFTIAEKILKNRKLSDKEIPEYIWSEEAMKEWLTRNRNLLSIEKRFSLSNILKNLRKAYMAIYENCENPDISIEKKPTVLQKQLIIQETVIKCAKSIKKNLNQMESSRNINDRTAVNYIHKKLLDELPKEMLVIYLESLIYLRSRVSNLLDGMIEAFVEVHCEQPVSIAFKSINEIKYKSDLHISFPPLPIRLSVPKQPLFIEVPSFPWINKNINLTSLIDQGGHMNPEQLFPRCDFFRKQFRAMGQHESLGCFDPANPNQIENNLGLKLLRSSVEQIQKDTIRSEMGGERFLDFNEITPQQWADAVILSILVKIRKIENYNTRIYLYGWNLGAKLISQAIARMSNQDIVRISGVILLGMPIEKDSISIDSNLLKMFRIPVFMACGENNKMFHRADFYKLNNILVNQVAEFKNCYKADLEELEIEVSKTRTSPAIQPKLSHIRNYLYHISTDDEIRKRRDSGQYQNMYQNYTRPFFHSLIVPNADEYLRMDTKIRVKKYFLTKKAVDHNIMDKIFDFVVSTMNLNLKEKSNLIEYRPLSSALTDIQYLEDCESNKMRSGSTYGRNQNRAINLSNLNSGPGRPLLGSPVVRPQAQLKRKVEDSQSSSNGFSAPFRKVNGAIRL